MDGVENISLDRLSVSCENLASRVSPKSMSTLTAPHPNTHPIMSPVDMLVVCGVVLSQVIPSEVKDGTGDNMEKPGEFFPSMPEVLHVFTSDTSCFPSGGPFFCFVFFLLLYFLFPTFFDFQLLFGLVYHSSQTWLFVLLFFFIII